MSTCIITGAGSGIGRATAIQLSNAGRWTHIALLGRNRVALEETRSLMSPACSVSQHEVDLVNFALLPEIIADIYRETRSIDCLLNIAGYTDPQPLLSTTLENLQQTYSVNVFAPFLLTRECVRYMKKTGGVILNVASTAGMSARPGWLSYSSSKAAVISMSKTLTDELAEYGVKVYCVSPGRCATNLRRKLAPDEDPSTIMQPHEVAQVICNLLSESGSCLDGQNIVIRKQTIK